MLFRVDPATGIAEEVDLGGEVLPSPDGLELRGHTLYVVGGGVVTVVRLGARLASGVVLRQLTDPSLAVPTTATTAQARTRDHATQIRHHIVEVLRRGRWEDL